MVEALVHALALTATVVGSAGLYLTLPHQRWLARTLPTRPYRTVCAFALVEGWLLWSVVLHPATAAFTSLTVAMLLFTVLPFAAAARAAGRSAVHARRGG